MTDTDMPQMVFNGLFILLGVFGGYYLNSVKDAIKGLQTTDQMLITKLQAIELLVAGTYLKRDDFNDVIKALFAKLDKIDEKLDAKADRSGCIANHGRTS